MTIRDYYFPFYRAPHPQGQALPYFSLPVKFYHPSAIFCHFRPNSASFLSKPAASGPSFLSIGRSTTGGRGCESSRTGWLGYTFPPPRPSLVLFLARLGGSSLIFL